MTSSRAFTLLWTPASAALSIAAVLATAALCYAAWRRSGYRRSLGGLEALRLGIVILGAVLLNQPEWVEEHRPEEKPAILVLVDASTSMETRDVASTDAPGSAPRSRAEAAAPLASGDAWRRLSEHRHVLVERFAAPEPGRGTDIFEPLAQGADKVKGLLGVVLVSDGDWTEGQPPVRAAARLRARGVPVFAVPVGSPTRLPDLEALGLDAPTFGVAGKSVRIPFTIDSSLPRDHVATVRLTTSDGEELTREVRVTAMGRTSDSFVWKPAGAGELTLTLDVPRHPLETVLDNNQLTVPITIRETRLKVLVIESWPRWEYRYLRNALSRDPGVDLSCLLFHPGLSKVGGGSKDYIRQLPAGPGELSRYDVLFLGDVGLEDGQLTAEECRWIKGLVEQQASGVVLMPGLQGRLHSLLDTELGDLFPVLLDPTQPGGWGSRVPGSFELTESGRRSLLTRLADTQEENVEVWESLPGFQWYAPVLRARPGTEVLAVHKDIANEFGRLPLLVTRTYGAGKVLFMGTDGAWRWRRGVEDKHHYRFWGQVVRWMAYQRTMARGESMRLFYSPDQPQMRQTLSLNANVMDGAGEPLMSGEVTARVVAPSGRTETVRFSPAGEEWGLFRSELTPAEAGKHQVTLACKETGASLEASIFVQGALLERAGRPARPEVLEEIARVTRGRVVEPGKLDSIVESLAQLPDPPPSVRRIQLWSHPAVAGGFVLLLGVFWALRKVAGLI